MKRPGRYTVRYRRTEAWWEAKVEGAPRLEATGRSLSQTRKHVRMMLALDGLGGAVLVEDVRLPPALQRALDRVREARAKASLAGAAEQAATVAALRLLLGRGRLSVRDAADLLQLGKSQVCELAARAK
ncbi:hypothetical protein ACOQFB_00970 [Anaeromyxobacter sp. Red801]|uniref:hypothetical protein n=1 Tax=Anaeromyxobacter sp. Red801 TaxID=3411632 RepID=UPI003BA0A9E6